MLSNSINLGIALAVPKSRNRKSNTFEHEEECQRMFQRQLPVSILSTACDSFVLLGDHTIHSMGFDSIYQQYNWVVVLWGLASQRYISFQSVA
jgi:hypothetical protein